MDQFLLILSNFVKLCLQAARNQVINIFNTDKEMSKASRSPTLREYIENYQQLKHSKTNPNLLSLQKIQVSFKPTNEFENQINQKLAIIKKLLISKTHPNAEISALQLLHELGKIVGQLLLKLKHLEGIDGNLKSNTEISSPTPSISKKVSGMEKKLMTQTKLHRVNSLQTMALQGQLMSPQALSKQIKFSNDLTNTVTTQDLSPRQTTLHRTSTGPSHSEQYFRKQIKGINSLGLERENSSRCSEVSVDQQYRIKVSHCSGKNGEVIDG